MSAEDYESARRDGAIDMAARHLLDRMAEWIDLPQDAFLSEVRAYLRAVSDSLLAARREG